MKKRLLKVVIGIFLIAGFNSAYAELFINPIKKINKGASELSGHFGTSSVDYDFDGASGDIDRTFLGISFIRGMGEKLDVYGTFSYTLEAEAEGVPGDDSGLIFGGGVRGIIPNDMGFSLHGYAQLLLIDEDYNSAISGEETSIMAGVVASAALNERMRIYGGLELNLLSDLEVNGVDADRDDFMGFRLGANFDTGGLIVNASTALIHETGFFISAAMPF